MLTKGSHLFLSSFRCFAGEICSYPTLIISLPTVSTIALSDILIKTTADTIRQCSVFGFLLVIALGFSSVNSVFSHGMQGNQLFKYLPNSKQMYHPVSNQCMDCDAERGEIFMDKCDEGKPTQQWVWTHFNITLIEERNAKAKL